MDSSLRPREIQARIRSGESLEDVARAAGVPPEQIAGFAAPVLAEREHIAATAQAAPVRRAGETVAHRALRALVSEHLLAQGLDIDIVAWDAWRVGDRRWWIKVDFDDAEGTHHEAVFTFDQTGRFSVPSNEDARRLVGERPPAHATPTGRRRVENPDEELTIDLNDQFAIVRAIQPINDEDDVSGPDTEDAYTEAELAEVDGVYDFVPAERSNMDVLYDMLSSFDEDSVQIYAGLVRATPDAEVAVPVLDQAPDEESAPETRTEPPLREPEPEPLDEPEPEPVPPAVPEPVLRVVPPVKASPEPDQPRLVDEGEGPNEPTRPIKRKRASVPSWDEIMFGSPTPPKRP